MKTFRILIITFVLAISLGITYWQLTKQAEQRIERAICHQLSRSLGTTTECQVQTSVSLPSAVVNHKISSIAISGRKVKLGKGLTVEKLSATLYGVRIGPVQKQLKGIDRARFSLIITEEQLTRFLARRYPDLPNEIELRKGYISVTAPVVVRGKQVTVIADVKPTIEHKARIVPRPIRLMCGSYPAPSFIRRYVEQRIVPVLDLSDLGFKGQLTSITIMPKFLTITGEGKFERLHF